jgi:hypothetical protein
MALSSHERTVLSCIFAPQNGVANGYANLRWIKKLPPTMKNCAVPTVPARSPNLKCTW